MEEDRLISKEIKKIRGNWRLINGDWSRRKGKNGESWPEKVPETFDCEVDYGDQTVERERRELQMSFCRDD